MKKHFLKYSLFLVAVFLIGGAGCRTATPGTPIPLGDGNKIDKVDDKIYVSKDPGECERLRFQCEKEKKPFFDDKGCGCMNEGSGVDVSMCTLEYKPVCGEVDVQCITAPCPPIKQTFGNRCLADQAKARNITDGECQEPQNTYLEISEPTNNQVVNSPVTIKGRVLSPWLVEGIAPIEIQNSKGVILGKGSLKGSTDWQTRSGWMDFQTTVSYSKADTATGFVVLKRANASGRPDLEQQVKIPVNFNQNLTICATIYKPVCGEIQMDCAKEPCLPIHQTYSNRCTAEAAGAKNIIDGECKADPRASFQLNFPKEGALITSPLAVKGKAKGMWFSEGSFPIEITNKNGGKIAQGVAKASGEWMTENFVNFEANILFKTPAVSEGFIVFKKDNPSGDQKTDMQVKIPIKFSDKAGVICPAVYKPVCGEIEVQCIKAPCLPLKQTFSNRCTAEGVGAKNIIEGECKNNQIVKCQVTGCNKEICSDKPMNSICIAGPEYKCYEKAQCGVQKNGICGWTQTEELKKCLEAAVKPVR